MVSLYSVSTLLQEERGYKASRCLSCLPGLGGPLLIHRESKAQNAKCFHSGTTGSHLGNAMKTLTCLCHLFPF